MRLRLVKDPFDDPAFLWELKMDGFRAVAYIEKGECRLVSRNLRSLRFDSLQLTLAKLPAQNAIIDGEIVCLDLSGVSQFNWLLNGPRARRATFYAFDLLWVNNTDLRRMPLIERKSWLSELIHGSKCSRALYAQHIDSCGKKFFEEICERDLEGVVAKRKLGVYREDRQDWIKIKNRNYSQAEGRHQLLRGKRE